jgi:hypothetical protein
MALFSLFYKGMNLLKSIVVAASPSKSYMPVGKAISVKDIKKQQLSSSTTLSQRQGTTRKARIIKQSV